jgi:hypothetical protein
MDITVISVNAGRPNPRWHGLRCHKRPDKYLIMANPPPPYSDLTGISRTVMKDNAQATVVDYNGNARPAEFTVNTTNNDIYIGNATGALTRVMQVTGAATFLGNVRVVTDATGLQPLYIDPTTGEILRLAP